MQVLREKQDGVSTGSGQANLKTTEEGLLEASQVTSKNSVIT